MTARMAIEPTSQTPIIAADEMAPRIATSLDVGDRWKQNGPTEVYVESPATSPNSDQNTWLVVTNGNTSAAGHIAHCHQATPSSVVRISHSAKLTWNQRRRGTVCIIVSSSVFPQPRNGGGFAHLAFRIAMTSAVVAATKMTIPVAVPAISRPLNAGPF